MNWFSLSVACAFLTATTATLSKIILKKKSEILTVWGVFAFATPLLLIALFRHPPAQLGPGFWKTVAIVLPLEACAILLYMRALKFSPLSLVFPFLGLTPVFTILTSSVILKEKLAFYGIWGVFLVSLGAYLLNAHTIKDGGVLAPIKNLYREKGSMLMILVAFIYSLTSVLGKKAILLSSPQSFPGIYFSLFFVALTPFVYLNIKRARLRQGFGGQEKITFEKKDLLLFLAAGISFGISALFHCKAISLVSVSYMISVKRLSLVIGVFYGALVFKERNIGYRLLGSLVILCGVLILALAR